MRQIHSSSSKVLTLGIALSASVLACGQADAPEKPIAVAVSMPVNPSQSGVAPEITAAESKAREERTTGPFEGADDDVPLEKFGDGARAFAAVKDTLLRSYYADGIDEDALYRAATAGMLEKLDPKMKKWNRLLPPREVTELRNDLKGEVVGVGVIIKFDGNSGYSDVLGALPNSPAEKAGLTLGDKVITVNGKLYKGMRMKDVVTDIRGKAGDPVKLSILREGKLLDVTILRARVAYDQPTSTMLPEAVGYLSIPAFTDKTPGAVRAALEDLERKGAKALVVDVRTCPGGGFDRAIDTTALFLPEGTPIVTLRRRSAAQEEKHVAKGKPVLVDVPIALLVDAKTSSGGEILAAALQEGRRARVVGDRTMGKWSVQSVDDLPNGFAFKYTVSLFFTPTGKTYDRTGLSPDVRVTLDDETRARAAAAPRIEDRLALDTQLRTASELLHATRAGR